jgi:hypothetical protein
MTRRKKKRNFFVSKIDFKMSLRRSGDLKFTNQIELLKPFMLEMIVFVGTHYTLIKVLIHCYLSENHLMSFLDDLFYKNL